ncbi:MAG: outer membrane protein transport protein [Acidobacteria bacterium]|nr:outer membrane protein transport protein [Acidobacteriota bacterium]MCB9396598.1 outer membrane protein transport protein [Acidobacteriota bacterium]
MLRFSAGFSLLLVLVCAPMLWATDGMNLEGYGPISTSLGGASMGYYNGLAAVMNNPATLILIRDGKSQFEFSFQKLGPTVHTSMAGEGGSWGCESTSDAFYMPAIGWAKRVGNFSYGVGLFAQGGMGCAYPADSWLGMDYGLTQRSEVSVGRLIVPLAYQVNPRFALAGSVDFVWAGLDLQMGLSEGQFMDMTMPNAQQMGRVSGSMMQAFGALYEPFGGQGVDHLNYAYFDFSNDNDFTGETQGYGFAGKLGFLYLVNDRVTLGGTVHSKTYLSDLDSRRATMTMGVNMDTGLAMGQAPNGNYMDMAFPLSGQIAIRDFQWPWTYGLGAAWQANPKTMVAFDLKYYQWSQVMDAFQMGFQVDNSPSNGMFGGLNLDATLFQDWQDQWVYAAGIAYQWHPSFQLRGGVNLTQNPVPDRYLNALFPAIVEDHLTGGFGYEVGPGTINVAMVYALKTDATNPGDGTTTPAVTSSHKQLNWTVQYNWHF